MRESRRRYGRGPFGLPGAGAGRTRQKGGVLSPKAKLGVLRAIRLSEPMCTHLRQAWAAALGLPDTPSSRVSLSDSWSWLEHHRLLRSSRDGRLRRIWLLDDTGSGAPYAHGGEATHKADYFKLPHAFWLEGWNERLDLPAKSVLLIALSLRQAFSLPHTRGGEWYGISRDTIRRGVDQLRVHDLLTMRVAWRATLRSPTGATEERRYTLAGPFAPQKRRAKPRTPASQAQTPTES